MWQRLTPNGASRLAIVMPLKPKTRLPAGTGFFSKRRADAALWSVIRGTAARVPGGGTTESLAE